MIACCSICSAHFTPYRETQKYCGARCKKEAALAFDKAASKARVQAARSGRTCCDCGTSIADRMTSAKRCEACAHKNNHRGDAERARRRERSRGQVSSASKSISQQANETLRAKGHAIPHQGSANLKCTDLPRLSAPRPKFNPKLPNLGAGEGFDGWDGCWSPSISPTSRALIEKHLGLPDPMKQSA